MPVRRADLAMVLAAGVFLAFPVVALLGGWHGHVAWIGLLTCLGFVALALHAALALQAPPRWVAVAAFLGAAGLGLVLAYDVTRFLDLEGGLLLFLLGAVGAVLLARARTGLVSWALWAAVAAWLIEGLASVLPASTGVALAFNRSCDGVAAAGLVTAAVCSLRGTRHDPFTVRL